MNYRQEVLRTLNPNAHYTPESRLTLAALGLAGETGEVVDLIKKHLFHGKLLDREKLILELGDVRWYLESLAFCLNIDMQEIETKNIAKLRARFPEGFTHADANSKKDEMILPPSHHTWCDLKSCKGGDICFVRNSGR